MTNRETIILNAQKLFNKNGYGAVSLFEIAQESGVSRGNITYHFKDKDRILEVLVEEMMAKIEKVKYQSKQFPSFENLNITARLMYDIQSEYSFIFFDSLVQSHDLVKDKYQKVIDEFVEDCKAAIAFSVEIGNMKPEMIKGIYNHIATICQMITFYWIPQQMIRGKKIEGQGEKIVWGLLIPHFTDKGLKSFKNYFGEPYMESLGEPFEKKISQLITF